MRFLYLILILPFLLIACGGEAKTTSVTPGGGEVAKTIELVKYAGSQWYGHAPVWVGIEKGIFADAGFDVELVQGDTSANRINLIATDSADFSSLGEVAMLAAMDKGEKGFYWIGNQNIAPGNEGIVARAGINSIEELKGKKIALSRTSSVHITTADVLKQHGMSMADVEIVHASAPDVASLFEEGSVDAGVIWEPHYSALKAVKGATVLATDKDTSIYKEFKTMSGPDVICVSKKWLDADKDRAKRFFTAYFAAVDWCAAHPEKLVTLVAKRIGKEDNLEEVRRAMENFQWLGMKDQPSALNKLKAQSAAASAILLEEKIISSVPKVTDWMYLEMYR